MTAESGDEQFQSLIALNRALLTQHLLRGIAHDLRNHLQVLTLGLTMDGGAPPPSLIVRLEEAVQAMSGSLDLLARLGRMEPDHVEESDLGATIEQVVRMADLQRNLPSRRIEWVQPMRPVMVPIGPSVLTQILLNLVTNAKLADGSPNAVVSIQLGDGGPDRAAVTIEDRGPGLPASAGVLWATSGNRSHHAGLGLPVVTHLLARYGGELRHEAGMPHRIVLTVPLSGPG